MEIGALLRDRGLRMTEARRLVWDVLEASDGHLTAQQIAEQVHAANPGVNLSSVYRSLSLFAELDLIRESNLGVDGALRWESAHSDDHFHLVCASCGGVQHHADDVVRRVREHLRDDHGFDAGTVELVATGTCAACAGR